MTTREESLDPEQAMAAAEAAHLAARQARLAQSQAEVASSQPEVRPQAASPRRRRGAPLPLAAVIAVGWAAIVSLAPAVIVVVLVHAAEPGASVVGHSARVAVAGWLLAHGVPVSTAAGPLTLAPLALTVLAVWRVVRAGVHVTRAMGARGSRSPRWAMLAAAAVGLVYGTIGAALGAWVETPEWGVEPVRAGLTLAGFGVVAGGYGALHTVGSTARWSERVPGVIRDGGRCGTVAALALLAAGAATAGIAIAADGDTAAETLAAYQTGVAGLSGLVLLCIAYAPNLAVWVVSYLVGPGFAVGSGTVVRGSDLVVGSLPPLPVFAGLPKGPLPTMGALLLLVPVVAGGIAGWLLARTGSRVGSSGSATKEPSWTRLAGGALTSGVVGGLLLGVAAALSRGSLGGGALATMGPAPVLVSLFSTLTLTVGALLGAGFTAGFARR